MQWLWLCAASETWVLTYLDAEATQVHSVGNLNEADMLICKRLEAGLLEPAKVKLHHGYLVLRNSQASKFDSEITGGSPVINTWQLGRAIGRSHLFSYFAFSPHG